MNRCMQLSKICDVLYKASLNFNMNDRLLKLSCAFGLQAFFGRGGGNAPQSVRAKQDSRETDKTPVKTSHQLFAGLHLIPSSSWVHVTLETGACRSYLAKKSGRFCKKFALCIGLCFGMGLCVVCTSSDPEVKLSLRAPLLTFPSIRFQPFIRLSSTLSFLPSASPKPLPLIDTPQNSITDCPQVSPWTVYQTLTKTFP